VRSQARAPGAAAPAVSAADRRLRVLRVVSGERDRGGVDANVDPHDRQEPAVAADLKLGSEAADGLGHLGGAIAVDPVLIDPAPLTAGLGPCQGLVRRSRDPSPDVGQLAQGEVRPDEARRLLTCKSTARGGLPRAGVACTVGLVVGVRFARGWGALTPRTSGESRPQAETFVDGRTRSPRTCSTRGNRRIRGRCPRRDPGSVPTSRLDALVRRYRLILGGVALVVLAAVAVLSSLGRKRKVSPSIPSARRGRGPTTAGLGVPWCTAWSLLSEPRPAVGSFRPRPWA
jgi:hypothetical protein